MKLTDQQIEELFVFTKQHYVEWYDVQVELVDHLANDIEAIWQEEPKLSFEKARDKSFKKFGICGFMDVVNEQTNALSKQYSKQIITCAKTYFKFPRIALTALLILLFYTTVHAIESKSIFIGVFLIMSFVTSSIFVFRNNKKIKRQQKESGKKWLFEKTFTGLGVAFQNINILFQVSFHILISLDKTNSWNIWYELGFSLFIVILGILTYVSIKIVPVKMREKLSFQYPEIKIVTI